MAEVLDDGGKVVERHVAVKNADLERRPWNDLPARDPRGRRIRYNIDAPGDDRPVAPGKSGWRARWDALVGPNPQRATAAGGKSFRPTQYAHAFWINRAEGLLGIQYWFFYPFNEWINRHEGDWEHVNVVLKGDGELGDGEGYRPAGYQFAFHGWRLETGNVARVGGPARPRTTWWCSSAGAAACCGGGARPAAAAIRCRRSSRARARARCPPARTRARPSASSPRATST